MGRRSIADLILEDLEDDPDREGTYLLIYDFPSERRATIEFHRNLDRIRAAMDDGLRIQYSVLRFTRLKTAHAARRLAKHYGAETRLFEGKEIE